MTGGEGEGYSGEKGGEVVFQENLGFLRPLSWRRTVKTRPRPSTGGGEKGKGPASAHGQGRKEEKKGGVSAYQHSKKRKKNVRRFARRDTAVSNFTWRKSRKKKKKKRGAGPPPPGGALRGGKGSWYGHAGAKKGERTAPS